MGLFDQSAPTIVSDPEKLLSLRSYLAFDQGRTIAVRPVSQRRGGVKYAVDQLVNPQTVVLDGGGMLDAERLIAGYVGTATNDDLATDIYALFAKVIRRKYEKIKSYYVGPEAVQLLDDGVRLTINGKVADTTYDLAR
ncbi:MAG: hypothetical protein ACLPXB_05580 [Thiobacillaceae bacterium]